MLKEFLLMKKCLKPEIAKRLLKMGFEIEKIYEITKLSEEEIKKLK